MKLILMNLGLTGLDRVKKELEKNNLEACILFDPVNVRYALDTVNMSIYNMHNLNTLLLYTC